MTTDPSFLHYQKGNDYLNSGKPQLSIKEYLQSIKITPLQPEPHHNLAIAYERSGKHEQAIQSYLHTIKLSPRLSLAHYNLGNLYLYQGKLKLALNKYNSAIKYNPKFYQALLNKGITLYKLGLHDEAADTFKVAISINNHPNAYNNLAMNLIIGGQLEEAIHYFKEGHHLYPNDTAILSNYIRSLMMTCNWSILPSLNTKLNQLTQDEVKSGAKPGDSPFTCLIRSTDPQLNLQVSRAYSNDLATKIRAANQEIKLKPHHHKRLRIGYLSYDFRDHVIAYHLMSVFKHHDRKKFQAYAYSYGPNDNSRYQKYIKKHSDKFVDLTKDNYSQAAAKIAKDEIDILIDLAGHTIGNRFEISALKPAPIQVSYLGYPGSTGADFIDYIITDKHLTPIDQRKYISEK